LNPQTGHIVICLLAAHLIGDFLTQSAAMVKNKGRILVLAGHTALVAALSYLLCGLWAAWQIPVGIFLTHTLIDFVKTKSKRSGPYAFIVDQAVHVAVIVALAFIVAEYIGAEPWWLGLLGGWYFKTLIIVSGAIASVKMGGFLIGAAVRPIQQKMIAHRKSVGLDDGSEPAGFEQGGMIIGQLERALIFILTLTGQAAGIGFLIAAKSILRFGEAQDPTQRMDAEYIIIGTLMSFGWGIVIAYLTLVFLQQV
jgi:hypothetical protein